jgi:hypothetical protein
VNQTPLEGASFLEASNWLPSSAGSVIAGCTFFCAPNLNRKKTQRLYRGRADCDPNNKPKRRADPTQNRRFFELRARSASAAPVSVRTRLFDSDAFSTGT